MNVFNELLISSYSIFKFRNKSYKGCFPFPLFQSTRPRGARLPIFWTQCPEGRCFNPRAREGRDPIFWTQFPEGRLVSIHAPARGATEMAPKQQPLSFGFNPRAREGRDSDYSANQITLAEFQSTRPRGARHVNGILSISGLTGFNPRAREGRDMQSSNPPSSPYPVSIHAPARGATQVEQEEITAKYEFQSTRPRGARHRLNLFILGPLMVSIHAPARGATSVGCL